MALIDYDKQTEVEKVQGTINSGVKSGDSENELMILEPLQKHPEIEGLYRAMDNETGWMGWTKYSPPVVPVEPAPEPVPTDQEKFNNALGKFRTLKEMVDAGVLTATEAKLDEKRTALKTLYNSLNE